MMPDFLHIVPVRHDTMLYGILQGEDATLGLSFVVHKVVLLTDAYIDALEMKSES